MSELPKNWEPIKLGAVVELVYGKSLTKKVRNRDGIYPVYGSNGIVDYHDSFLIGGPAIVVGRKGAAGIPTFSKDNCWPIDTTYYVQESPVYDLKFIFYLLVSLRLDQFDRSTAIPGLNRDDAYNLDISLPPLNEQKRIVSKIEELFSELDKGIESLKTAREQLKVYRQAILDQASNGELLVHLGIEKKPFGENQKTPIVKIIEELGQGWSPKCHNHPSQDESKWGVITTTAIQHLSFDESENKELPDKLKPRPHLEIVPGDILVTRAGPRKRVGVTCLVRKCRKKLMICDKAYRLRPDHTKILPEYLEMVLNTPKTLWKIEELKTGINDSGVNLTQKRFLELEVFVPSIKKQKIILGELEGSLSKIEYLEKQIDESLTGAEALRQSILKRAFSGNLVVQDPKDEPASVLLERIKFAQNGTQKKKRKVA